MTSTIPARAAAATRVFALLAVTIVGCAEIPTGLPPGDSPDGGGPVEDVARGDLGPATVDVSRGDSGPAAADVPGRDAATPDLPACVLGAQCPPGFACYTTGCLPVSALGEPCGPSAAERTRGCDRGLICAPLAARYRCVVPGTDNAPCIDLGRTPSNNPIRGCLAGLACYDDTFSDGQCRPGLSLGEFCEGTALRCVEGLECGMTNGVPRCLARTTAVVRMVPVGSECDGGWVQCTTGASCVPGVGASRCVAYGGAGARCLESPARLGECDPGLDCQAPTGSAICRRRVARGMPCDPTGMTTNCAEGDGCATGLTGVSTCAPAGTVPGSDCRTTVAPPCDGDLRCSNFSRYRSTCRVVATVGGPCDLRQESSLCPDGTRCNSSERAGVVATTCSALVAEIEPNDAPTALGSAVTGSTVWHGALSASDPQDCFAVTSPGEVSLRLEACTARFATTGLVLSLFGPAGTELARWNVRDQGGSGPLSGCGLFTPETHGILRRLPAGTATVCLRSTGAGAYQLAVGVLPP